MHHLINYLITNFRGGGIIFGVSCSVTDEREDEDNILSKPSVGDISWMSASRYLWNNASVWVG